MLGLLIFLATKQARTVLTIPLQNEDAHHLEVAVPSQGSRAEVAQALSIWGGYLHFKCDACCFFQIASLMYLWVPLQILDYLNSNFTFRWSFLHFSDVV